MLGEAMEEVQQQRVPYLQSLLTAALDAVRGDDLEALNAMLPLQQQIVNPWRAHTAAEDSFRSHVDVALLGAMSAASNPTHVKQLFDGIHAAHLLDALPIACALTFVTPGRWDHVQYQPTIDAFDHNEHCLAKSMVAILKCAAYCKNEHTHGTTAQDRFLRATDAYFAMASRILVDIRCHAEGGGAGTATATYKFTHYPLRAMTSVLEHVVREAAPVVSRATLERHCPYTVLHGAYVDLAIGKQKTADKIVSSLVLDVTRGIEHTAITSREAAVAML